MAQEMDINQAKTTHNISAMDAVMTWEKTHKLITVLAREVCDHLEDINY